MADTSAKIGNGTTFQWNDNLVAELANIGSIDVSRTKVSTDRLDAPDMVKEYLLGLFDVSDLPLEGNWIPGDADGQAAMYTDFWAGTPRTFIITLPTAMATTWTGTAEIVKLAMGQATAEGIVPFTASLKVTGKPALGVTATTGLTTPFFSMSESAVIVPAAATAVYEYVATVLTAIESVTITPTATGSQVITVDGNVVATGVASSAITLGAAGTITDSVIVVSYTGKISKTYTIHITRAAA